jgi:hypothetical protein
MFSIEVGKVGKVAGYTEEVMKRDMDDTSVRLSSGLELA